MKHASSDPVLIAGNIEFSGKVRYTIQAQDNLCVQNQQGGFRAQGPGIDNTLFAKPRNRIVLA